MPTTTSNKLVCASCHCIDQIICLTCVFIFVIHLYFHFVVWTFIYFYFFLPHCGKEINKCPTSTKEIYKTNINIQDFKRQIIRSSHCTVHFWIYTYDSIHVYNTQNKYEHRYLSPVASCPTVNSILEQMQPEKRAM